MLIMLPSVVLTMKPTAVLYGPLWILGIHTLIGFCHLVDWHINCTWLLVTVQAKLFEGITSHIITKPVQISEVFLQLERYCIMGHLSIPIYYFMEYCMTIYAENSSAWTPINYHQWGTVTVDLTVELKLDRIKFNSSTYFNRQTYESIRVHFCIIAIHGTDSPMPVFQRLNNIAD